MLRIVAVLMILGFSTPTQAQQANPLRRFKCKFLEDCNEDGKGTRAEPSYRTPDGRLDLGTVFCGVAVNNRCDGTSFRITLAYQNPHNHPNYLREYGWIAPGETFTSDVDYLSGSFLLNILNVDEQHVITESDKTIYFGEQKREFEKFNLQCRGRGRRSQLNIKC